MVSFDFSAVRFPRLMMSALYLVNPIAGFTRLYSLISTTRFVNSYVHISIDLPLSCILILISAVLYFVLYCLMERDASPPLTQQRRSQLPIQSNVRIELRGSLDSSLQMSMNNQSLLSNPSSLQRATLSPRHSQVSSKQVSS